MLLKVLALLCLFAVGNAEDELFLSGDVVDMHSHTTSSDGSDIAIEVVRKAAAIGLSGLAITDHDQITIPEDAMAEAKLLNIELFIGVELSCEWVFQLPEITNTPYSMVHLLGYFFELENSALNTAVRELQQSRRDRNELIVEKLTQNFNFPITIDEVNLEAEAMGSKTPGRAHFAKVLLKKGFVDSIGQAFQLYLGDSILGLPRWGLSLERAVELIHNARGVAVLAHPGTILITSEALDAELGLFLENNPLDGLEVYSSKHTILQAETFLELAQKYDLKVTGGSDYHGVFKANVELGLFGEADEAWQTEGWSYVNAILSGLMESLHLEDDLLFTEGTHALVLQVSTYMALFGSFLGVSFYIQRQFDPSNAPTDPIGRCISQSAAIRGCCVGTTAHAIPRPKSEDDPRPGEHSDASDQRVQIKPLLGSDDEDKPKAKPVVAKEDATNYTGIMIAAVGLNCAYITWGFFQERIMTQNYGEDGEEARFTNSEFLVLLNRVSALIIAIVVTSFVKKVSAGPCPVFKYSFCSMTNIMSSWFQYEALKYISFPMQALAKSSKIVFTMLMGKFVSAKQYHMIEYVLACLITAGLVTYRVGGNGASGDAHEHKEGGWDRVFLLGCVMISGYVLCDSFTSTWQSKLFSTYKVNSWQMMRGVNTASTFIGLSMLCLHGTLLPSIQFMMAYPQCLTHSLLMSACSAIGQMFIFHVIETYGAVVFATIMTLRQILSILLSTMYYGHPVNGWGILGMGLVFCAMGLKVMWGYMKKKNKGKK